MELARPAGVTHGIARQVGKPVGECHAMFKMLSSYESLGGKPVVVIENGVRITKCPPAFAHGVYPQRNVGSKG